MPAACPRPRFRLRTVRAAHQAHVGRSTWPLFSASLDEGVDIPAVSHALILASSQNPRQFIQRRGRVLRKAPWKNVAVIHDAIVVPLDLEHEPEQASLLRAEFVRAMEFADSALNRAAGAQLRSIATSLGIDPEEGRSDGLEEDNQ